MSLCQSVCNGQFVGSPPATGDNLDVDSLIVKRPSVAHAFNDEFESTTLNAAWSWWQGSGTLTPLTMTNTALSTTSSGNRYQIHTQRRRSWIQWQVAEGTVGYLLKPITLTTDMCLWTMFSAAYLKDGSFSDNSYLFRMMLCVDNAGAPNIATSIELGPDKDAASQIDYYIKPFKNGTIIGGNNYTCFRLDTPYLGFRKASNTYELYAGGEGFAVRMPTSSTDTYAWFGYRFTNNSSEFPIYNVNFVRRVDNLLALPW